LNIEDAEEYTQALGQVVSGSWRQIALAERLGVPETLGLSTSDWVQQRLGGYVRLSISERREAVAELAAGDMSTREIAAVIGVDHSTVARDLAVADATEDQEEADEPHVSEPLAPSAVADATEDQEEDSPPPSGLDAWEEEGMPAASERPAHAGTLLELDPRRDDEDAVEADRRRRHSRSFAESLVALWSLLDPDPVAFFERTWDPGANPHRSTPGAKDAFTVKGLELIADRLADLADYIDHAGGSL
jgi:hypothetical protein